MPASWKTLPLELKKIIVKLTIKPRVIQLSLKTDKDGKVGIRGTPGPNFLQIDSHCRSEFGRQWVLSFGTIDGVEGLTRINFEIDTIYFDATFERCCQLNNPSPTVLNLLSHIASPELNKVQNLALHQRVISSGEKIVSGGYIVSDEEYSAKVLEQFGQVKLYNVIHQDYKDPIVEAGLTKKQRMSELALIEVMDITEKFHWMQKWVDDLEDTITEPLHEEYNNISVYKPYKSRFKQTIREDIANGILQPFPIPQ